MSRISQQIDHLLIAFKSDIDQAARALLGGDFAGMQTSGSRFFASQDLKLLSVQATSWSSDFGDEVSRRLQNMPPGPRTAFTVICGALLMLTGAEALVIVGALLIIISILKFGKELKHYLFEKIDGVLEQFQASL